MENLEGKYFNDGEFYIKVISHKEEIITVLVLYVLDGWYGIKITNYPIQFKLYAKEITKEEFDRAYQIMQQNITKMYEGKE